MLHNVIDVDWISMTVSLRHDNGALLLFDFKAAFPSVSHPFLLKCLEYLGLPMEAMNFIRTMYHNNNCYVRMHGKDFPGFHTNCFPFFFCVNELHFMRKKGARDIGSHPGHYQTHKYITTHIQPLGGPFTQGDGRKTKRDDEDL